MTFSQRTELVAIDDGFDYTKVKTRTQVARIPSSVSLTPSKTIKVMGEDNVEHVYVIDGKRYAVGPKVSAIDTRFEGFTFDPANLAIAMDGIRRVVEPGTPVHVICGVPLSRFYFPTGAVNTDIVAMKSAAWSRHVQLEKGSALPRITKVSVIAEAVAAWFDYVIDDNYVEIEDRVHDFMAVVDIGGRTTDIAVFQDGNINLDLSGTLDSGMINVQKAVENVLVSKAPGTKFARDYLEAAVRNQKAKVGAGGPVDLSNVVQDERRAVAQQIKMFMSSRFGSQLPLMTRILFVGGGAEALQLELRESFDGVAEFAVDSQMANARGMLKFGVTVAGFDSEPLPVAVNG